MTRLTRRIARYLFLLALPAMLAAGSVRAADFGPNEYELKARFVFSFIRQTEWLHGTKNRKDAPFIIGVFGTDPIADTLREALKSSAIKGRAALIRNINTKEEIAGCHVLVVGRGDEGRVKMILGEARREGVLTIGESDRFLETGGVIQFVRKGAGGLGYKVDIGNARRDGLQFSGFLINNSSPQSAIARPNDSAGDRRMAGTEPRS